LTNYTSNPRHSLKELERWIKGAICKKENVAYGQVRDMNYLTLLVYSNGIVGGPWRDSLEIERLEFANEV
jgi:hypothetical protein